MTMITYEYRGVYVREWPGRSQAIQVYYYGASEYFDNIPAAVARFIELVTE